MNGKFSILDPCLKEWQDLEGDGRARFCETCQTHVHAIADYSTEEWNRLWRESNGRVCGFLCGESPAPPRSRRAILVGALLTAASPLFAASGRVRFRVKDPIGEVVAGAEVSLTDAQQKVVRTLTTSKSGEAILTDLPLGDQRFVLKAAGFRVKYLTITIRGSKELKIEAYLEVGGVGQTIYSDEHPKYKGWLQY